MNGWFTLLLAACLLPGSTYAARLGDYATVEFAPARGQTFPIPLVLEQPADVEITLYTSDGDLVRTLRSNEPLPPGTHNLLWDGKDATGAVLPDEAYIPVLKVKPTTGEEQIEDPRTTSGGETLENLPVEITAAQDIAYTLPAPARVLIRAGIKGGPMLRSLANWQPRGPGRNIQHWDGRDSSGLVDLRGEPNLSILVTAFRLPEHAIITNGNTALDYRAYRTRQGWPEQAAPPDKMVLSRGATRLSRHYYAPRSQDADPRVTVALPQELPRAADGLPQVKLGQTLPVTADIAPEDRWLMTESLYEVAFFIDHQFVSEEEQGYVPLTWLWTVNGLAPGRHLLTVNISGFSGKVGVASALLMVAE